MAAKASCQSRPWWCQALPGAAQLGAWRVLVVLAQPRVVPAQCLLSRQSFSAAMARSTAITATTVRAGTEIKVATERPAVSLTLTELDPGSWVIFELPGFTTAASGAQQSSLDALRKASATSYFKDKGALWVKVVSNGRCRGPMAAALAAGASLQVSR